MPELGQLLSLEYGAALQAERRAGHGFPVFGSNGEVGRHDQPLVDGPGIVVGRKGSVGKVCWSEVPFWPIDTTYWVKCAAEQRRWIYWLLSRLPLAELDSSTGVPGLNRNDVYELNVFEPTTADEKSKIAEVLDTLDTTIRQTEAIIEKLKQVKQGLLHDLLTRGIDANGELRPPQSQAPHLYKDSPLGWIPNEWEAIRMAEAIRDLGQGWSPDCPPERAVADRWGVLKTTAIVWDGYADHENKALPATLPPRPDLEVAPEDILITRAGPKERVAVVAYVAQTRPGLMISDKMYRLRLREAEVPAYFALALSSQYAQAAVTRTISGMADSQTNISQPIIRMLQVMRPPTGEQRAISLRAAALADRLRTEQGQLTALGSLKIGLMDDLLTGRVRVTPLLAPATP